MKSEAKAMKQLCRKMARDIGDGASAERFFAQKMEFAAFIRSSPRKNYRRYYSLAFASACAIFLCVLFLQPNTGAEESFTVGTDSVGGKTGSWVVTSSKTGTFFKFNKGSRIELHPQTTARVLTADQNSVEVSLKEGVIDANIVGNGHTKWLIHAGPYQISVLGTRFTVDWQKERGVLDVGVVRGKVLVQGPEKGDHGVVLKRGAHLHATAQERTLYKDTPRNKVSHTSDPNTGRLSASTAKGNVRTPNANGEASSSQKKKDPICEANHKCSIEATADVSAETKNTKKASTPESTSGTKKVDRLAWLVHYANGEFEKALAVAGQYGIDKMTQELDEFQLWKLQDAARVTRRTDLSTKILRCYRERFPQNSNSRVANFLLGRIAMNKKNYSSASQWFNTYISEDPSGPLAEEAHGLLIVVYEKLGDASKANQAAKNYMKRYKGGAFAKIARAHINAR